MKKIFMIAAIVVGLAAGCATREHRVAELNDLPFDVQRTILEQAPNGDIYKVQKDHEPEGIVNQVTFHDSVRYPTLHIAADGTLLDHGRPVILREPAGTTIVPEVRTSVVHRERSDLPLAVINAIRAHAPNARIVDVDKEIRDQVIYEVQFDEPGVNPVMHFTEDGRLVEVK